MLHGMPTRRRSIVPRGRGIQTKESSKNKFSDLRAVEKTVIKSCLSFTQRILQVPSGASPFLAKRSSQESLDLIEGHRLVQHLDTLGQAAVAHHVVVTKTGNHH